MTTMDELYQTYRRGLITRHICLNGRVDENTWLGQMETFSCGWIESNMRVGMEKSWRIDTGLVDEPKEYSWVPLYSYQLADGCHTMWGATFETEITFLTQGQWDTRKTHKIKLGKSWGGGDNPLLSTGMGLATFSLEYLANVNRTVSLQYADLLFSYIDGCEYNGFFLRTPTHLANPKWASTDEMIGVAVGLHYYWQAKRLAGQSVANVTSLVSRWAATMGRHGYWLVPDRDHFYEVTDRQQLPDLGKQQGWIFAYVFRSLFMSIAGKSPTSTWDDDEWDFYFGEPRHYDSGKFLTTLLTYGLALPVLIREQLAAWLEDAWNWIFGSDSSRFDQPPAIWNLMISTGLYEPKWGVIADLIETRIEGLCGRVESETFFMAIWENVEKFAEESHPLFNWLPLTIGVLFAGLCTEFSPGLGTLVGFAAGEALGEWFKDKIYDRIDGKIQPFNFHLIGLYGQLGLELSPNRTSARKVAHCLHELLRRNHKHCQANAFLFVIFRLAYTRYLEAGGSAWNWHLRVEEAQAYLRHADLWQHDLPLGQIMDINQVSVNPDQEFKAWKGGGVDITTTVNCAFVNEDAKWRSHLQNWALPWTYNPHYLVGESRTWEHDPDDHVYTSKEGWCLDRAVNYEGPGLNAYAKALFSLGGGRDIRLEGCGLDLLFPIALERFWHGAGEAKIEDKLYPVLPYLGAGGPQPWWEINLDPDIMSHFGLNSHDLYAVPAADGDRDGLALQHTQPWMNTWPASMEWYARKIEWKKHEQARPRIRADWGGEDNRIEVSRNPYHPGYAKPVPNWRRYRTADWAWWCKSWQDLYRFRGWKNLSTIPQIRVVEAKALAIGTWECIALASNSFTTLEIHRLEWPPAHWTGGRRTLAAVLASPIKLIVDYTTINMLSSQIREWLAPHQPLVHARLVVRPFLNQLGGAAILSRLIAAGPVTTICDTIGPECAELPELRYILNMNSLVIHDLRIGHPGHLRKAARGYRIVPLPIPVGEELRGKTIPQVLARLEAATESAPGYWDDLGTVVRRRDYTKAWFGWQSGTLGSPYVLLPHPRMAIYLEQRAGRKRDYEIKNRQRLRLCSYCFSSDPSHKAPS